MYIYEFFYIWNETQVQKRVENLNADGTQAVAVEGTASGQPKPLPYAEKSSASALPTAKPANGASKLPPS